MNEPKVSPNSGTQTMPVRLQQVAQGAASFWPGQGGMAAREGRGVLRRA